MMFILVLAIILFVVTYNRRIKEKEAEHQVNIKNKELEMLRAVIGAQESEREVLAGNLHDEVGPLLSALKFRMSKYQRDLVKNKFDPELLESEKNNIDDIMQNVRTVSHNLTPQFLLKFGLVEAIRNHICGLNDDNYAFESNIIDNKEYPKLIETNTYRIALELINNLLKYDKPEKMLVSLNKINDKLALKIEHSGFGIDNTEYDKFIEDSTGLGLISIKSRSLLINAELKFKRKTDSAAFIELTVPI